MKNTERYRHLRVDWVGQSITLCGVEGEDIGAGQALCPDCAQVGEALNVCGLGPESLRELFDTLRVFGPSEVKAKMEALRGLGVWMDMQDRSSPSRVRYAAFRALDGSGLIREMRCLGGKRGVQITSDLMYVI